MTGGTGLGLKAPKFVTIVEPGGNSKTVAGCGFSGENRFGTGVVKFGTRIGFAPTMLPPPTTPFVAKLPGRPKLVTTTGLLPSTPCGVTGVVPGVRVCAVGTDASRPNVVAEGGGPPIGVRLNVVPTWFGVATTGWLFAEPGPTGPIGCDRGVGTGAVEVLTWANAVAPANSEIVVRYTFMNHPRPCLNGVNAGKLPPTPRF